MIAVDPKFTVLCGHIAMYNRNHLYKRYENSYYIGNVAVKNQFTNFTQLS